MSMTCQSDIIGGIAKIQVRIIILLIFLTTDIGDVAQG